MITYNPSLPNIGEIMNKYWGLLALSEKQSVKYVFQHKPILAFKRPQNLGDILIHSKMNFSQNPTGSVSACKKCRWTHCKTINESENFSEFFLHKQDFNCTSENVIYLITCKKCNAQYVGQTHQKVSKRMNSHRFDILHYPESITNVSVHFNENGHSVDNFSFTPIDKVENEWPHLLKETYWMHHLKTLSPNGMNTKVLYQIHKTWNILFMSLGAVIPAVYICAWWWLGFVCALYWPVHPRILISVFNGHFVLKLWAISYPLRVWWELWSECADAWAEIGLH